MKVMVSGATGLLGTSFVNALKEKGHEIGRLVRSQESFPADIRWDPDSGSLDAARLEGWEAFIHLAGESIAEGRWSREKKKAIRDSRVNGTTLLSNALAQLATPPRVFISASAIGYYGDRGSEILTEESGPGKGFLPEVCVEWEAATAPARDKGIRVVNTRFGIILSSRGGALAKMLLPFRMGAGGKLGNGGQYFSWIVLDDVVSALNHILVTDTLSGPVNTVSPNPVTNAEFTQSLARVLRRPAIATVPAFAARLLFGEMADALLLASARVMPAKLIDSRYSFLYPDLEGALYHVLHESGSLAAKRV